MSESRLSHRDDDPRPREPERGAFLVVEWIAASVLVLIMLLIGWMTLVSYQPSWLRLASERAEVIGITALLTIALILVSVVALRDTR